MLSALLAEGRIGLAQCRAQSEAPWQQVPGSALSGSLQPPAPQELVPEPVLGAWARRHESVGQSSQWERLFGAVQDAAAGSPWAR